MKLTKFQGLCLHAIAALAASAFFIWVIEVLK